MRLKYYAKIEDSHLSGLLIHTSIKTETQWMVLIDSSWHDWPDNEISKGACIVFYKSVPIDHCTHISGPFSQSSSESDHNAACTAGMSLSHSRMINNKLLKNDPDVVP